MTWTRYVKYSKMTTEWHHMIAHQEKLQFCIAQGIPFYWTRMDTPHSRCQSLNACNTRYPFFSVCTLFSIYWIFLSDRAERLFDPFNPISILVHHECSLWVQYRICFCYPKLFVIVIFPSWAKKKLPCTCIISKNSNRFYEKNWLK